MKILDKEVVSDNCCFKCKDGGDLLICDFGECLKTYHAACIRGDTSFIESGSGWTCDWHFCFHCNKRSEFFCVSCPKAVCQHCYETSEIQTVKGAKGICNHCLKLALLGEENKDVDSDGEKVDFSDIQTYEGLFLDYWRNIIVKQEGLSLEHLHSADAQLRMRSSISVSDPEEESDSASDFEDKDVMEKKQRIRRGTSKKKRSHEQKCLKKMDVEREFIDWGSKPLILFLESIGNDTSKKLCQFEVAATVDSYVRKNKLLDQNTNKKVICDEKLKGLFGKRSFRRLRIYDMIGSHLLKN